MKHLEQIFHYHDRKLMFSRYVKTKQTTTALLSNLSSMFLAGALEWKKKQKTKKQTKKPATTNK